MDCHAQRLCEFFIDRRAFLHITHVWIRLMLMMTTCLDIIDAHDNKAATVVATEEGGRIADEYAGLQEL